MQLVLDTKGLTLTRKNGLFHIEGEKGSRSISPAKLTSIAITATVMLGSDAVTLAIDHQIPILFFDRIGTAKARLWSPYFSSIATLRRMQVKFAESPDAGAWLMDLLGLKAEAQADNLKYLRGKKPLLQMDLGAAIASIHQSARRLEEYRDKPPGEFRQQIMGVEGASARVYWQALGGALPRRYAFRERSRRPAKDIFNAAINYLYGMLYSVVEGAVFAAGLDPHLGILHADEYDKPTLAFDLIEPFRPWMDRLLIDLCTDDKLLPSHFSQNQYGLFLNKEGKALIIPLFNDYLRSTRSYLGQESTLRNHIFHMAGRLAQRIRATLMT
jgi:CRISPR-associated protein Cas1